MTEAQIQAQILLTYGALPNAKLLRMNVGVAKDQKTGQVVKFGTPGQPDIFILYQGGRIAGAEVKTATGRQSDAQKAFQRMMESLGCAYALVRSVDDMGALLRRIGVL